MDEVVISRSHVYAERRGIGEKFDWPLLQYFTFREGPRTFARRFSDSFHQTPASWIRKMRAELAKTLLQEPHSTIKLVAQRCGFRNVAALRDEFVLQFGTTPKEYKTRLGL